MLKRCLTFIAVLIPLTPVAFQAEQQQRTGPPPSIDERTSGMRTIDGYFPLYWDDRTGSMFPEVSRKRKPIRLSAR